MTADAEFNIEVNAKGENDIKAVASAVNSLGDSFQEITKAVRQTLTGLNNIEKGMASAAKTARNLTSANKDAAKSTERLLQQQAGVSPGAKVSTPWGNKTSPLMQQLDKENQNIGVQGLGLIKQQQGYEKTRIQQIYAALDARRQENNALRETNRLTKEYQAGLANGKKAFGPQLETGTNKGSAEAVAGRFERSGLFAAQDAQAIEKLKQANLDSAKAAMDHANRLTNLRYSLYDVRNTALITSVALAAMNIGTLKAAMDYETAMAQISRTSGATGSELDNIRAQFIDLAQTIPTAFGDLAKIGELGGQLNIPSERLGAFTETVAKFTATTNVAAEQSATAFGRLDALLDDVNGNYEALGSSILSVGVNSVATETEIIATTNQITAAAQQAGFAAKEIIGLAASFASLGVAPEAARGTTIRVLSTINTAVAESNENLDKLAGYAQMSADQFKTAWGSDAAGTFQAVLNGMKNASDAGENLEGVIRSMGITAVRDINALLKLGQNAEIVADNFMYAAEGFDNATALGDAFEVQAATLASKLQVLANSFQALLATLGESGIGPIGAVVDMLNGLLKTVTDLAANPIAQWFAVVVGGATALAAVGSLLVSGLASLGTSAIAASQAFTTLKFELLQTTGGAAGASAAIAGLSGTTSVAAARAQALTLALKGLLATLAVGGAVVAIGATFSIISERMKSGSDRAKEYFGSATDLANALKEDARAAADGAASFGTVEATVVRARGETARWAQTIEGATGTQVTLDGAVSTVNETIGTQTFQIGENAKAWLASQLASDEALASFVRYTQAKEAETGIGFDTDGFLTKIVANDIEGAKALIDQFNLEISAQRGFNPAASMIDSAEYVKAMELVDKYAGQIENAADKAAFLDIANKALGISTTDAANAAYYAADAIEEVASASETASTAMQVLQSATEDAFLQDNAVAQMAQDFYSLASGVYESGNSFNALEQSGGANLANLQSSVVSTIMAGQALGASTTDSVAALFIALQAMGVDTANLMARVSAIAGVSIGSIQSAMGAPTAATQGMANALMGVSGAAQQAARSVGGGGGGGGGRKSVGGAAKAAAKEVKTLLDYAKDLSGVWNRAFDIRFNVGTGLDEVTSGWREISEASAEANRNIADIQAQLSQIGADRSAYEYFLSVAEMYGDQLRAADIRAKLAQLDADQAEESAKLTKEQDKTNKSLEGNSTAAVENRKTILGMVSSYQDLIEQYAASGMDQTALAVKTAQLKREFLDQATQLGYNVSELDKYSAGFDDVAIAVQRIPRDITVQANINPALQALNEFVAKAAKAGTDAGNATGGNMRSGIANAYGGGPYIPPIVVPVQYKLPSYDALMRMQGVIRQQTGDPNFRIAVGPGGQGGQVFATGGYTGDMGTRQIAGQVHGKEFVVNAENTARFRPILEAMNKGQMPLFAGASNAPAAGIQVVELSSYDRQLLAAAGNVSLSIDGRVVADASNRANFVSTTRGSN